LARRGRGDVEQLLRIEPELFGQHERLAGADHRNRQQHVVADLGGLSCARAACEHDTLSHLLKIGLGAREGLVAPPHMKVSVPASAPPTPPETGASRKSKPAFSAAS
jgi:hypothetical protein